MTFYLDDGQMTHVGALRGTPADEWTLDWLTVQLAGVVRIAADRVAIEGGDPADVAAATLWWLMATELLDPADPRPAWLVPMWVQASLRAWEAVTS
jgi:hypothetical protein